MYKENFKQLISAAVGKCINISTCQHTCDHNKIFFANNAIKIKNWAIKRYEKLEKLRG